MTRRNNWLLPCPSERGKAYIDSMAGLDWTYESFFDGIDDKIKDFGENQENLHALGCPPMDVDYFKREANFTWMIDGNVFDNDAVVDSIAIKTYNKSKGSLHGKEKPQSFIGVKLQPNSKDKEHTRVACGKGKEMKKVIELYSESKMLKKPAHGKGKEHIRVVCGKGKDMKKVIDLYSESKMLKKQGHGEDKELKILPFMHKHTNNKKVEYESCSEMSFEKVMSNKIGGAANEMSYELKLEGTKRKLQENYRQCKKRMKVQLIDLEDVPSPEDTKPYNKKVPKPCNKKVCSFAKRISKASTVKQ